MRRGFGWLPTGIAVASLLTFSASFSPGQVTAGTLRGVVTDPNGAIMAGVDIRAQHLSTNQEFNAASTTAGVYVIGSLPIGIYRVQATSPGFKTFAIEGVQISTGTTSTLNVEMEIGDVVETVTVAETVTPLIQVSTPEVSTNIEARVVMDLPLQMAGGRRQAENFVFLTPGVTGDVFSKSFNGSPDLSQVAMVDGVAFSNAEVPGRFDTFSPPFEAVEEFKVSSTLYPAELGRGFGVANYTIKSGTNEWHGNVFEFLRNDKLDARGFFAATKFPTRQNEFGGSAGGPVLKNRLFFFGNYTGFRLRGGNPERGLVTLPIAPFRQGDFSQLQAGGQLIRVYDPSSLRVVDGSFVRDPFPNNMLPSSGIDPIARQVAELIPQPDTPNAIVNNYVARNESPTGQNIAAYRLDYNAADNHKLYFSHWFNFRNTGQAIQQLGRGEPLDSGFPGGLTFHGVRANYDWIASPAILNHFAFGFSGTFNTGRGRDSRNGAEVLPIPGLPNEYPGITAFNITGFPKLGNAAEQGDNRFDHTYNFSDTVSIVRGKHQIKFGGEVWWQSFRNLNETQGGGPAGNTFFDNLLTDNPSSPTFGNEGYSFASFLLGQVNSSQRLIGAQVRTFQIPYQAVFVSDIIQLAPRLTMSLGLRWDIAHAWRDKDPDRISAISLSAPNPGAGNFPGAHVFGNANVVPGADRSGFGPRASLAYQINNKTVIRTGYGIIYAVSNASTTGASQFGNGFDAGFLGFQNLNPTDTGITPVWILGGGFPAFTDPVPNRDPGLSVGGVADFYNPTGAKQAYQQSWTLNIQRELPFGMFVDLAYVGTKGQRLSYNLENLNQVPSTFLSLGPLLNANINSDEARAAGFSPPYPGFNSSVAQALRPFPQYSAINHIYQPGGQSTYHSYQMKLQKRFSRGLSFLTSYTLSKTLTDSGLAAFANFNAGARDTANRGIEKALAAQDRTHNLIGSFLYEIPIGKNAAGAARKILHGWQVSGVARYVSGTPIGIGGGPPLPIFGGGNRPNRVPDVSARSDVSAGSFDPARDRYLNPNAFSQPAPFTFGTGAPQEPDLRTFARLNEDFSIIKRTYITETVNVEFRAEFFNIFNRVVFGGPATNANDPASFGLVGGVGNAPRIGQLGLKINF